MNAGVIIATILGYIAVLFTVAYISGRKADNEGFFVGNRSSSWWMVMLAMVGAAMSGVTFVSVPGMVAASGFSYFQMALGFMTGYFVIAFVLIPLFYKRNLVSIYGYLEERFGTGAYKTGAWFFFISKLLGASVRLFLICVVLQLLLFEPYGLPFWVNAAVTVLLVLLYTFQGGVKSLIWTDTLKTVCLILSIALSIFFVLQRLDMSFADFKSVEGGELLETLQDCYDRYGRDETIVITRSNKRANRYNEGIRRNTLFAEEEIESGDMLMVVKNNYHYTERIENCPMNFIANGDIAKLKRIRRFESLYGFRYASAVLEFADYDCTEIECKILLDTLTSESPSLTYEQSQQLFYEVEKDYTDIKSKIKRFKEIRENEYYNALQVKFSYAVTCHKAQGGQWSAVFIDRFLFGDELMTKDMLRWLYTAITRATDRVFFVNFDESFFE